MMKTFLLLIVLVGCSQHSFRKPAQADLNIKHEFRDCFEKISKLIRAENIGSHPWGWSGAYLMSVYQEDIPGANEYYLKYRYQMNTPEFEAALSSRVLYVTEDEITYFTVPNFHALLDEPLARVKIQNDFFYFNLDVASFPTCFYDNNGQSINSYKNPNGQLSCPKTFNRNNFVAHNKKIKKNPLIKFDQKGEYYSELIPVNSSDDIWVEKAINREIKGVLEDLGMEITSLWARAVLEAQNTTELVNEPDAEIFWKGFETESCKNFQSYQVTLDNLEKEISDYKKRLRYYNQF